jgi:hypothetical protein
MPRIPSGNRKRGADGGVDYGSLIGEQEIDFSVAQLRVPRISIANEEPNRIAAR